MRNPPNIEDLRIDQIAIPHGRRSIDPRTVSNIMKSLESSELFNPIHVRKEGNGYVLIAGAHRLEAFRQLGRSSIPAIVLKVNDLAASRAEIEENLCRKELSQTERTRAIQRLNDLLEQERPQSTWGGSRWSNEDLGSEFPQWENPEPTSGEAGGNLVGELKERGMSPTSAYRQAKIAKRLPADVLDFLEHSPADNNVRTAEALSRLSPEEQRAAVSAVKSGRASTIRDAIEAMQSASAASEGINEPRNGEDQGSPDDTPAHSGCLAFPEPSVDPIEDGPISTHDGNPRQEMPAVNDLSRRDNETMSMIEDAVRNQFDGRLAVGAVRLETLAYNIRSEA